MDHYALGVEVPPLSTKAIRKIATSLRATLGVDDDKPFPIAHFIELVLPQIYPDFSFEVLPAVTMEDKHGETFPDLHVMRLREDVYDGMCDGKGRDRFTAAHECGHLILHEGAPLTMARRSAKEVPRFRNSEWQADAFAGELLMPFDAAAEMSAASIQMTFLVSRGAAKVRRLKVLKELGR